MDELDDKPPRGQNFTFHKLFPIQTVRGSACSHIHYRVKFRKLSIFADEMIKTNYIHKLYFYPV